MFHKGIKDFSNVKSGDIYMYDEGKYGAWVVVIMGIDRTYDQEEEDHYVNIRCQVIETAMGGLNWSKKDTLSSCGRMMKFGKFENKYQHYSGWHLKPVGSMSEYSMCGDMWLVGYRNKEDKKNGFRFMDKVQLYEYQENFYKYQKGAVEVHGRHFETGEEYINSLHVEKIPQSEYASISSSIKQEVGDYPPFLYEFVANQPIYDQDTNRISEKVKYRIIRN